MKSQFDKVKYGVGLLFVLTGVLGCGSQPEIMRDPISSLMTQGSRNRALIELRKFLPKTVVCPETIELNRMGISWVDMNSCRSTDMRRQIRFQALEETRLVRRIVHMGFDRQWLEVKQNNTWVPIGRGVSGLRGKAGARILEGLKSGLEQLSPANESPHRWMVQVQPFLFF